MVILVKYLNIISEISAIEITFFRFLTGFIIILTIKIIFKKSIKPVSLGNVLLRGMLNSLAVVIFFIVIALTTLSKANLYNMTFPVFVVIIAHFFIKEKMNLKAFISVLIGFTGIFFVIGPDRIGDFALSDLLGIISGLVAGCAIVSLKNARKTDEPFTIIFFLMSIGFVMTLVFMIFDFTLPSIYELILLILIGILAVLGQYTLTVGFKYVKSSEGSIISTSRIFLVSIFSILFFNEDFSVFIMIGGILLFLSIFLMNIGRRA